MVSFFWRGEALPRWAEQCYSFPPVVSFLALHFRNEEGARRPGVGKESPWIWPRRQNVSLGVLGFPKGHGAIKGQ